MASESVVPAWDAKVLNMAAELQTYQQTYARDAKKVPVPQFILLGPQSIGKTRTLSCIAACKLGGAEKAGTGTRCPVVYKFQTAPKMSFKVGQDWQSMEEREQGAVSEYLTAHMDKIGQTENREAGQPGFTNIPVNVQVEGPEVPSLTIVDLPGIKKADADNADFIEASNERIVQMYKEFLKDSFTVPIILVQFETTMDMGETNAGVNNFLRQSGLSPNDCKKAVVVVTRLDAVKASVGETHVAELLSHLRKKVINEKRVVMATLRPELLSKDGASQDKATDDNTYFQTQRSRLEREHLEGWLNERGLTSLPCCFGFANLIDILQKDLTSSFGENGATIRQWLVEKLQEELAEGDKLCKIREEPDKDTLRLMFQDYFSLYTNALAGAATREQAMHLKDYLVKLKERYPDRIKKPEDKIMDCLTMATRRTFEQEAKSMRDEHQHRDKAKVDESWLLCEEVQEFIDQRHPGMSEWLEADGACGGSAAVRRLLQRFGLSVILKRLTYFTKDDLLDLSGGELGMTNVVGPSWDRLVRAMVEHMEPPHYQIQLVCWWCMHIYISQARIVCETMRDEVDLLREYPQLRKLLDTCIIEQYEEALSQVCKEAIQRVANQTSFRILDMDEIVHTHTLLNYTMETLVASGCVLPPANRKDDSEDLVQQSLRIFSEAASSTEGTAVKNAAQSLPFHINKVGMKILARVGFEKVGLAVDGHGCSKSHKGGQDHQTDDANMELFLRLLQPTGFKIEMMDASDNPFSVAARVKKLNKVTHTLVRTKIIRQWEGAKGVIHELFEAKASQTPKDIHKALSNIPQLLLGEKHKDLFDGLTCPALEDDPKKMKAVADRLRRLCGNLTQLDRIICSDVGGAKGQSLSLIKAAEAMSNKLRQQLEQYSNACTDAQSNWGGKDLESLESEFHVELRTLVRESEFDLEGDKARAERMRLKREAAEWKGKYEDLCHQVSLQREGKMKEDQEQELREANAKLQAMERELREANAKLRAMESEKERELREANAKLRAMESEKEQLRQQLDASQRESQTRTNMECQEEELSEAKAENERLRAETSKKEFFWTVPKRVDNAFNESKDEKLHEAKADLERFRAAKTEKDIDLDWDPLASSGSEKDSSEISTKPNSMSSSSTRPV